MLSCQVREYDVSMPHCVCICYFKGHKCSVQMLLQAGHDSRTTDPGKIWSRVYSSNLDSICIDLSLFDVPMRERTKKVDCKSLRLNDRYPV